MQLLAVNNAQTFHAVCFAPMQQLLQTGLVLFVKAHDQGAVAAVGEVQLVAEALHHAAAGHVELRLFRAGHGVKACVNDGGIGLAGAHAHVLALFAQGNAQVIPAQLPCCGTAHSAAADDDGVINHVKNHSFSAKKATQNHAQDLCTPLCMTQILIAQYVIIYV